MKGTVKVSVRVGGVDGLAQRLAARHLRGAADAAATRAAQDLADALARAARAPVRQEGTGAGRRLVVADGDALARERGTLATPPAPWLAAALLAFRRRRP